MRLFTIFTLSFYTYSTYALNINDTNSYSSTITSSQTQDFININIKDNQLLKNNTLLELEKFDHAIYNLLSFYVKKNGRLVKSRGSTNNQENYFRLNRNLVIASKTIDREEICLNSLIGSFEIVKTCEVFLEIAITKPDATHKITTVKITIQNINDVEPIFYSTFSKLSSSSHHNPNLSLQPSIKDLQKFNEKASCVLKVPESSKVGSRIDIKNCLAFDVDGDKISYEIVNSSSSIPSPLLKKFKLIKETQDTYLKLLQPLDYENKNKNSQQNSGTFILIADDGVNQSNEKVVLEVTDINDNVPVFGEKTYKAKISEATPPNTPVLDTSATDQDSNPNLSYKLSQASSLPFQIDPKTGQISTTQTLDFEQLNYYSFEIFVTDGLYSATAEVAIDVINENDNLPSITVSPVNGKLEILENSAVNTLVATVRVSDADGIDKSDINSGQQGTIVELLPKSAPFKLTELSKNSFYKLTTTRIFDHELEQIISIRIQVCENNFCHHKSLKFKIIDLNDNQPVCSNYDKSYFDVKEDLLIGSEVGKFEFFDADSNRFRHKLKLSGDGSENFEIDSNDRRIFLLKGLDYESRKSFRLNVDIFDEATVDDEISLQSCKILINVIDVNDNKPVFLSRFGKFVVPRLGQDKSNQVQKPSPIACPKISILAEDHDSYKNGQISYSLLSKTEFFQINENSGQILIKDVKKLNYYLLQLKEKYEKFGSQKNFENEEFTVKILASDNGQIPNHSKVRIWLELDDPNNDNNNCLSYVGMSKVAYAAYQTNLVNSKTSLSLQVYSILAGVFLVLIVLSVILGLYLNKKRNTHQNANGNLRYTDQNRQKRYSIASYKTKCSLNSSRLSRESSSSDERLSIINHHNEHVSQQKAKNANKNTTSEDGFFEADDSRESQFEQINYLSNSQVAADNNCTRNSNFLSQSAITKLMTETGNSSLQSSHVSQLLSRNYNENSTARYSSNNSRSDMRQSSGHTSGKSKSRMSEGSYLLNNTAPLPPVYPGPRNQKSRTDPLCYQQHQFGQDHIIEVTDRSLLTKPPNDVVILFDTTLSNTQALSRQGSTKNRSNNIKLDRLDSQLVKKTLQQQGQLEKHCLPSPVLATTPLTLSKVKSPARQGESSDTSGHGDSIGVPATNCSNGQQRSPIIGSATTSTNTSSNEFSSNDTGRESNISTTQNFFVSKNCTKICLEKGHSDKCWLNPKLNLPDLQNPDNQIRHFKRQLKIRSSFNGFGARNKVDRNRLDLNSSLVTPLERPFGSIQRLRPARRSGYMTKL